MEISSNTDEQLCLIPRSNRRETKVVKWCRGVENCINEVSQRV